MILSTTKPDDDGSNLKVGLITTHIPINRIKKNLSRKECLLLPIKTLAKALNL